MISWYIHGKRAPISLRALRFHRFSAKYFWFQDTPGAQLRRKIWAGSPAPSSEAFQEYASLFTSAAYYYHNLQIALRFSLVGWPDFKAAQVAAWAWQLRYMFMTLWYWETYHKFLLDNNQLIMSTLASVPWEAHRHDPASVHTFKLVSQSLVPSSGAWTRRCAMQKTFNVQEKAPRYNRNCIQC